MKTQTERKAVLHFPQCKYLQQKSHIYVFLPHLQRQAWSPAWEKVLETNILVYLNKAYLNKVYLTKAQLLRWSQRSRAAEAVEVGVFWRINLMKSDTHTETPTEIFYSVFYTRLSSGVKGRTKVGKKHRFTNAWSIVAAAE